jgi:hypothetical protein
MRVKLLSKQLLCSVASVHSCSRGNACCGEGKGHGVQSKVNCVQY